MILLTDRLADRDLTAVKTLVDDLDAADLARELVRLEATDRAVVFRLADRRKAASVFDLLGEEERAQLLADLSRPEAAELLASLPADDQAELLDEVPAVVAQQLLAHLDAGARASVAEILRYPVDSVGRHANPHLVEVPAAGSVADALAAVRASALAADEITSVFALDAERGFAGIVRLADLVKADAGTALADLLDRTVPTVLTTDDAADAARILARHDLGALPVLDSEGRLVGAFVFDDAMDAIEDDTTESMLAKAGIGGVSQLTRRTELVRSEKLTNGPIAYPVRVRLLFLLVTLAGGLAVGGLIDRFEGVLESVVAVAVFIPLVMDMGGNVGTQSTTIFARGLALGHIDLRRFRGHLLREVRVGLTMAVLLGVVAGVVAWSWQGVPNGVPELGFAVGVALAFSVAFASFLGFFLPWLLIKIGLDHAPGADPFITTIKDFTGLAVYFGLAATLLGLSF